MPEPTNPTTSKIAIVLTTPDGSARIAKAYPTATAAAEDYQQLLSILVGHPGPPTK